MKRIIIFVGGLIALTTMAYADVCPTVKEIKSQKLAGWKAYDSDDGTPLSKKRTVAFIKSADQFILAEWSRRGRQGSAIHCFYRDVNGSDLEAYLTKNNLVPENNKAWYQVSGAMQCAAGNDMCQFTGIANQPQLAKR